VEVSPAVKASSCCMFHCCEMHVEGLDSGAAKVRLRRARKERI